MNRGSSSAVLALWPAGITCQSELCRWWNPCPGLPCVRLFTCQPSFLPDSISWENSNPCKAFAQDHTYPCLQCEPAQPACHLISHCLMVMLYVWYGEGKLAELIYGNAKYYVLQKLIGICSQQLSCQYLLWWAQINGSYQGLICCTADAWTCYTHKQGKGGE